MRRIGQCGHRRRMPEVRYAKWDVVGKYEGGSIMRNAFASLRMRLGAGLPVLRCLRALTTTLALSLGAQTGLAVTIELKDVAPERVENQRAYADGEATLPGTPDISAFEQRLNAAGVKVGDAVMVRVFKSEAELEIWMKRDNTYVLFATYPICNWSGTLGPKLAEGDKQTPEGFYTITRRQLHQIGRWPRSLNLGFPNVYDQVKARSGSYILVHGGCSSVGCFAMTNPVINEIYRLTQAAIVRGQGHVPMQVFPFRMTDANLAKHANSEWRDFWLNLKEGYDAFEATKFPPRVRVCDGRYHFDRVAPGEGGESGPLAACGATVAAIQALDEFYSLAKSHPLLNQISHKTHAPTWKSAAREVPEHLSGAFEIYWDAMQEVARAVEENAKLPFARRQHPKSLVQAVVKSFQYKCNPSLASCRRFIALDKAQARLARQHAAGRQRTRTANRASRAR